MDYGKLFEDNLKSHLIIETMNDNVVQRALMGIRRGTGKQVKLLGHTNNSVRFLGQSYNTSSKMSHSKTKL